MTSEIETVITWTADDDQATVYSLMPKIWRWCEQVGGTEIRKDEGIREGVKKARTFLVDADCIRIRPRRKPTQAQLDALITARGGVKRPKPPIPGDG
jgi:hypothetical protein